MTNEPQPKRPRLRLDPESYKALCRQVMKRDGWRCQVCGSRQNLQVHHKQLRSQQGSDSNLITLCAACHEYLHRPAFTNFTPVFPKIPPIFPISSSPLVLAKAKLKLAL